MVKVDTTGLDNSHGYSARGIIARIGQVGELNQGGIVTPLYGYMTLDPGDGREPFPVELVGPAPVIEDEGERILDFSRLKKGDFVIDPGLLYQRCAWTSTLMKEHQKALQDYKPKSIITAGKAEDPPIDLGTLDPNGLLQ